MIPDSLLIAHSRLAIYEQGRVRGIRISHSFVVGPHHCLIAWGESTMDASGHWRVPVRKKVYGDVAYYEYQEKLQPDPVITELPPIGSQVWQITPTGILRTSRIQRYSSAWGSIPWFYGAVLSAAGPQARIPVGGDSGSVCWVLENGVWKVLGMCSYGGRVEISVPAETSQEWPMPVLPAGSNTSGDATPDRISAPWVNPDGSISEQKPQTIIPAMKLILSTAPSHRRVVGMFKEEDDGTDNIALDILEPSAPITSVEIRGAGSDKWAWPDNGANWIIRASKPEIGTLRLWFKASEPTASYTVWVNGNQTTNVLVKGFADAPTQPAPSNPPATNDERQYLLDKIKDLEAINARQAAFVISLRAMLYELLKP